MAKFDFEQLKMFGLSDYEIKSYVTLLTRGPLSSTDLVRFSGIPQPRIYDILQNLSSKGLIEYMQSDKRKTYIAVPPRIGLKNIIEEMEDYVKEFEDEINEIKKTETIILPQIWIVEREQKIMEKTKDIISQSKNEIIISASQGTLEKIIDDLNEASERDLTIALVTYPDVNDELIEKLNEKIIIKKREIPASEVIIGDRSIGLLRVESGKKENYGLYFRDDEFLHILNYYFYHTLWAPARYIRDFLNHNKLRINTAWLCCEAGRQLLDNGKKISGEFELIMKDRKQKFNARLKNVEIVSGLKHTIYIERNRKIITVGGKTARVEDGRLLRCELTIR